MTTGRGRADAPLEPGGGRALSRADLEGSTLEVLSPGGWANADVLLVRIRDERLVVKDFAGKSPWVRAVLARWLCRREQRAYRALDELRAVPRHLGEVDGFAFALEYRPGQPLSRALVGEIPPDFVGELRSVVEAMHARGVVHLDLRHYNNILAGEDGHPVLLDFASSLCLEPRGRLGRWLLPCLTWIDRLALRKWEMRFPPPRSPAEN